MRFITNVFVFSLCWCLQPVSLWATESIQVLHWWTSKGEAKAVSELKRQVQLLGIRWDDLAIHGGGGETAMAVLKAQAIAGSPPDVAQIIGPSIYDWVELNQVQPLSDLAKQSNWHQALNPITWDLIHHQGDVVAVPFSIHRINWLWYNPNLFRRHQIRPPTTWAEFFQAAEYFQQQGILPLAHGGQAWQTATLFENLILSIGGPQFYRELFVELSPQAFRDSRLVQAFQLLRRLKLYMGSDFIGREWHEASLLVSQGKAAMQIMGDWVKGEYQSLDFQAGVDFACLPVPGTQNSHLYSIDTFVFLKGRQRVLSHEQLSLANTIMDKGFQQDFSLIKGTIPARQDIELSEFDVCAQASAQQLALSQQDHSAIPSMAHSMANHPWVEDVFFDVVHRFFNNDDQPVQDAIEQLVKSKNLVPPYD